MVRVRLLGPVGVEADRPLAVGGGRQLGLLAMLALHSPPRRTDEQLVEGLWGDDPPASARNAVQVYVSGLRKALAGSGVEVVRSGEGYALVGDRLEVDAEAFATATARGRAALRVGAASSAVEHLAQAVALWTGEPLDGVGDLPFAGPARQHLTSTWRTATVELTTALLRCGRYDEAVEHAGRLLAEHPFDERAWIALATGHYWAGRQDEALATCRTARDTLAEELGVDPGPELAAVEQQVLRHELPDPAATDEQVTPPEATAATAAPVPLPPLPEVVGREPAIDDVAALLADARLVTLLGIGGIGKTTLAVALAHRLREEGREVAVCELGAETRAASALAAVCRTLGLPADDPVEAIAAAAPEVLVLDNLEQIADLAPVVDSLLAAAPALRLVATSRRPLGVRDEHEYRVTPLTSAGELGASPAEALLRLRARRVRTGVDGDPAGVRRLVELLDGIPLAIELAAARLRSQTPTQLADRLTRRRAAVLDLADASGRPARQVSLRAVLEWATEATSETARTALAALAWSDGWLGLETLESVLERAQPGADLVDALDELVGHGLLPPPEEDRARLPVPVRELVRAQRAEDPGVVPVLVRLAEEHGARLAGADAPHALERLSTDADALVTLVNGAAEHGTHLADAARVLIELRRFWLLTSRLPDVRRWVAGIRRHAGLDDVTDARLRVLDGTIGQWLGQPDAGEVLEKALTDSERLEVPADALSVGGWCNLAADAAVHGHAERAHAAASRAGVEAEAAGDPDLVAMTYDLQAFVAGQLGDHQLAAEAGLAGLARARVSADDLVVLERVVGLAESLAELGRDDEALDLAREGFDRMATLPPSPTTTASMAVIALVETVAGDVQAGARLALEAMRGCRDRWPSGPMTASLLLVLAGVRARLGQDVEAARLLGASGAVGERAGTEPSPLEQTRLGRLVATARERTGDRWSLHLARGAADPDRVVTELLASA